MSRLLTGSAKMTTCTVALPGVSKLTSGVRIVSLDAFIADSISASWNVRAHESYCVEYMETLNNILKRLFKGTHNQSE